MVANDAELDLRMSVRELREHWAEATKHCRNHTKFQFSRKRSAGRNRLEVAHLTLDVPCTIKYRRRRRGRPHRPSRARDKRHTDLGFERSNALGYSRSSEIESP